MLEAPNFILTGAFSRPGILSRIVAVAEAYSYLKRKFILSFFAELIDSSLICNDQSMRVLRSSVYGMGVNLKRDNSAENLWPLNVQMWTPTALFVSSSNTEGAKRENERRSE